MYKHNLTIEVGGMIGLFVRRMLTPWQMSILVRQRERERSTGERLL